MQQSIIQKLKDHRFDLRLNDLIVRINKDSRRFIKNDLREIKACAEGMVELILLKDKIDNSWLRPMDIIFSLFEASWSFGLINRPDLVDVWKNEILSLRDIHVQIMYEITTEANYVQS